MRYLLSTCALLLGLSAPALAAQGSLVDACPPEGTPSQKSNKSTEILFHNRTDHPIRVYWSNFDGVLTEYTQLQPNETSNFKTYLNHYWYVEALTSQKEAAKRASAGGEGCLGPVSAAEAGVTCNVGVLYDDGFGIGVDIGGCDYE